MFRTTGPTVEAEIAFRVIPMIGAVDAVDATTEPAVVTDCARPPPTVIVPPASLRTSAGP
jgi:hypothetical protein